MRKSLAVVGALAVAGVALGSLPPVKTALAASDLAVTSWGGAYQMSQRKAFFEPYAKANGVKVTEEEYNGEIAKMLTRRDD